jgi:hypothetical protein
MVCRIFLSSLTLCNTSSFITWIIRADLLHPSPAPHFKNFSGISYLFSKVPRFQHHRNYRRISGYNWMFS